MNSSQGGPEFLAYIPVEGSSHEDSSLWGLAAAAILEVVPLLIYSDVQFWVPLML